MLPPVHNIQEKRKKFMRGEGTAHSVYVGNEILDELEGMVTPLRVRAYLENREQWMKTNILNDAHFSDSSMAIALMGFAMSNIVSKEDTNQSFVARYSMPDNRDPKFLYRGGVADQEFSWYFMPFMAHECVRHMVEAGRMDEQSANDIRLKDWADLLRQEWFRELMHDMALTSNGTYGHTGDKPSEYRYSSALVARIRDVSRFQNESGYDTLLAKIDEASVLGNHYLEVESGPRRLKGGECAEFSVSLHPLMRAVLRERMKNDPDGSVGCPVARHHFSLDEDSNEHARYQLDHTITAGHVALVSAINGRYRYKQERTVIDRVAIMLADAIDRVADELGDPINATDGLVWEKREKLGLFEAY